MQAKNDISDIKVYWARDYDRFNMIIGNRKLDEEKIKRIIKEIESGNDMLKYYPVQVWENNGRLFIIDGQHRFAICKKLGRPVHYIIVQENKSIVDIARINSNVGKWKFEDFIDCYITQGNNNYKVLKDFLSKYKFAIGFAIKMLSVGPSKSLHGHNDDVVQDFYHGKLDVKYLEDSIQLSETLLEFSPFKYIFKRDFAMAVQKIVECGLVPIKDVIEAVQKRPELLTDQVNYKNYIYKIEEVFNAGKHSRTVIYSKPVAPVKAPKKPSAPAKKVVVAPNRRSVQNLPKFKTRAQDLSNKIPLKIDGKTTIYINKGDDPDEAKRKYLAMRTNSSVEAD